MLKLLLIAAMMLLPSFASAERVQTVVLTPSNTITLSGPVTAESMANLKVQLMRKYYSSILNIGKKTVYLVLDTPGGSVFAGDSFIDFAKGLNIEIKTISLFSASMGFHLVQNLGERLVLDSTVLMSHRASLSLSGELLGEFNSKLNYIQKTVKRLDQRIARRMNLDYNKYQYIIRDELWVDGDDALNLKAADRKIRARCSKDFKGVRTKLVRTIFGSMKVKLHACPLITTPVDVDTSDVTNAYVAQSLRLLYTNKHEFVEQFISNPTGFNKFKSWVSIGQ